MEYLQNLPYWPLYMESRGRPNLHPQIVADLQRRIADAQLDLKRGIDADWKECVVRYPQVLAHFYGQLSVKIPREAEMPFSNPVNNGQPRAPPPPQNMVNFQQQQQQQQQAQLQAQQQQQLHQQQMAAQINRSSTVQPKKARRASKASEFTAFDVDELARGLESLGRSSTSMGRAKSGTPGPPTSATPGPRLHKNGTGKKRESREFGMPGRGATPSLVGGHGGIPPHVPVPPSWATGSTFDMGVRY